MKFSVGYFGTTYPSQRMILNKVHACSYQKLTPKNIIIIYGLIAVGKVFPKFRVSSLYAKYVHFHLNVFSNRKVSLIHTFNRICVNDNYSWCGTFEKTFPEYFCDERHLNEKSIKKQANYILKDNCKQIFPLSNWSYQYEKWLLGKVLTQKQVDAICEKMTVLYPPQQLLTTEDEIRQKYANIESRKLHLIYVGGQIKRKGGMSVLRVLDDLSRIYSFEATVIGNLNDGVGNYYLNDTEMEECQTIIENSKWLHYHQKLANSEVLSLIKASDVGLLPTIGDTFGFSVLEMQASGCPVVTTNREAMPEINNRETGWIIDTKSINVLNGDDYANYSSNEIEQFICVIEKQLRQTLVTIFDDPSRISSKALNAFEKVARDNYPKKYEEELYSFYTKIFDSDSNSRKEESR